MFVLCSTNTPLVDSVALVLCPTNSAKMFSFKRENGAGKMWSKEGRGVNLKRFYKILNEFVSKKKKKKAVTQDLVNTCCLYHYIIYQ